MTKITHRDRQEVKTSGLIITQKKETHMKKRYLRASIQHSLVVIEGLLIIFLISINDYDFEFLPIYLGLWTIALGLGLFLKKYAKWERYMGEEYEM